MIFREFIILLVDDFGKKTNERTNQNENRPRKGFLKGTRLMEARRPTCRAGRHNSYFKLFWNASLGLRSLQSAKPKLGFSKNTKKQKQKNRKIFTSAPPGRWNVVFQPATLIKSEWRFMYPRARRKTSSSALHAILLKCKQIFSSLFFPPSDESLIPSWREKLRFLIEADFFAFFVFSFFYV